MNKKNYECLFIVASNVSEEKRNDLIAKFAKMVGSDTTVEKWGMRKFATPIDYRKEGFYVLMNFTSTGETIEKTSKLMNITDGLVRYMFVQKDEKQIAAAKAKKAAKAASRPAPVAPAQDAAPAPAPAKKEEGENKK